MDHYASPELKCVELALKSQLRHKHGAVIYYNGYIIGCGFNLLLTHPIVRHYSENKTLHAEMVAILRVRNKHLLRNATLYVARINKRGQLMNSKPCETCMKMIRSFGIRAIKYTDSNGKWIHDKSTLL